MKVLESKHDNCPGCGFPTRHGKVSKGEHSNLAYTCDEQPEVRVISIRSMGDDLRITHFEFTCPHCGHMWTECPSDHTLEEGNER